MKIKRFVAPDMRTAIRLVREEQGANAVILSNRRVGDEIEVVAATDYDESLVQQAVRAQQGTDDQPDPPTPTPPGSGRREAADKPGIVWAQDPHLRKLEEQLGDLRNMLEGRLGDVENLAWESRAPQRNRAVMALQKIGVDTALARSLAAKLPETELPVDPAALALRMLGRRLTLVEEGDLGRGAAIALVGPTGVGKTTTIAKLAARHAMQHGTAGLALVTLDTFRIGAQEQLRTYGRLLGVPVATVSSAEELQRVAAAQPAGGLLLIDTAGVGPRDTHLESQWAALAALPKVRSLLCLPANAWREDLEAAVRRFAAARPQACVITKLDETAFLGAALSIAVQHRLPIAYTTDGQNVPADLSVAKREDLMERSARLMGERARSKENSRACA